MTLYRVRFVKPDSLSHEQTSKYVTEDEAELLARDMLDRRLAALCVLEPEVTWVPIPALYRKFRERAKDDVARRVQHQKYRQQWRRMQQGRGL